MKLSLVYNGGSLLAAIFQCVLAMDGSGSNPKIDVHAHFLPDFYREALIEAGELPGPDGMPSIPDWSPESHLEFMQNNSIDKCYLSVSSPGVYLTVPSYNATQKAIKLARQVNEYASGVKAQYPDKFGFFASLPLPDISATLDEIDYVFNELDPKPDGVIMLSNYYGLYFGDPLLDPVYSALDSLGVTIFEHPTTPCTLSNSLAFNVNGSTIPMTTQEWAALNRPVAFRQHAAPILDFPFESARTFADLFYSSVPDRFSSLKWIIPHGGGAIVPTINRLITFSTLTPNFTLTESGMKEILARSFYFDFAGPWPVTSAIPALLQWVNYTKLLYGSDTPFTPWSSATTMAKSFDVDVYLAFDNDTSKPYAVSEGNAKALFEQ